jgi:hypothetical protein
MNVAAGREEDYSRSRKGTDTFALDQNKFRLDWLGFYKTSESPSFDKQETAS